MLHLTELSRRLRSEPKDKVLRDIALEMVEFPDRPTYRDVTHFLVVHDLVSEIVLNRSVVERGTAAALLRILIKYDAGVPQTLLRRTLGSADSSISGGTIIELLATMDEARVGAQLGAALVQMLRNCDDKVRSKVALVLGHNRFNMGWALQHRDRRVRANAIEAMWNIDSPGSRRMLYQALMDGDNRVRGNAVYGLLLLNDRSALQTLESMKNSTYAKDRATAAWVMGRMGWMEFIGQVTVLVNDKDPVVARQAKQALERLGGQSFGAGPGGTVGQRPV